MTTPSINAVSAILTAHFEKVKSTRAQFSLRGLAIKMEMSPAHLSQILSGKRSLQPAQLEQICKALDIDPETKDFLTSEILRLQGWHPLPPSTLRISESETTGYSADWNLKSKSHLNELVNWKYFAILDFTLLKDFDGSPAMISQMLNIDQTEASEILSTLKKMGYLVEDETGILRKTQPLMEYQALSKRDTIRRIHKDFLTSAINELDLGDDEARARRLISSATLTCSREQLSAFKLKLSNLMKELIAEGASADAEEVYQLSVAFFPLTKTSVIRSSNEN